MQLALRMSVDGAERSRQRDHAVFGEEVAHPPGMT